MDDQYIIDLFWNRDPESIHLVDLSYGTYCFSIANHILGNQMDAEECVNDTWLRAWETIPPDRPKFLRAFLGRITRNLAINRFQRETAQKRGGGELPLVLEELSYCIAGDSDPETSVSAKELGKCVNTFVKSLPARDRNVFVRRYFFTESVEDIAKRYSLHKNNVLVILHRTRNKLRKYLIKEGFLYE